MRWKGWRTVLLPEKDDGSWSRGKRNDLFSPGMDLSHFTRMEAPGSDWVMRDGVLRSEGDSPALVSRELYWNFDLEVEFRLFGGANSGVSLRGRYELQLFDDFGQPVDRHGNASIYSRIAPGTNAGKPAGEWQALKVRLIGRQVTVVLNGVEVIRRQDIAGPCGLSFDGFEDRKGPIALQGDHGIVEFRKVTVTSLDSRLLNHD